MTIRKRSASAVMFMLVLFLITAFGLLSVRDGKFDGVCIAVGALVTAYLLIQYNMLKGVFRHLDRFALLAAQILFALGMVVLYRLDPDIASKQLVWYFIGSVAMVAAMLLVRRSRDFGKLNWVFMGLTFVLLLSAAVFGRSIGGAKNWIAIGSFSFQPSEFAKILFLIVSAYFLTTRDRLIPILPYIGYTAACVLILVWQKDLGSALVICTTFLMMFYAATRRGLLTLAGAGVLGVGAVAAAKLFPHVATRVRVWQDPWANYYENGYQIVMGLIALAAGGLFGTGLGLGMPEKTPAASTDYIFTVIGEEFGILIAIFVIAIYMIFIIRGILIALGSRSKFDAVLVFGCCSMLALQSFIIIGGVIKLIPLTGITLPFVSYGGSSILSSMIQLGIIEGVAVKNGLRDEEEVSMAGGVME